MRIGEEAEYFRRAAERLNRPIAAYRLSANARPTVKRNRVRDRRLDRADDCRRLQRALYGLAQAWEDDAIPVALSLVVSRGAVELLLRYERLPFPVVRAHEIAELLRYSDMSDDDPNRLVPQRIAEWQSANENAPYMLRDLAEVTTIVALFYSVRNPEANRTIARLRFSEFDPYRLCVFAGFLNQEQWAEGRAALFQLIDGQPADAPEPDADVRRRVREIVARRSVEDFAPTPAWLAERLIAAADVRIGDIVLEPSAGSGAIVDHLVPIVGRESIRLCESSTELCELLAAKGYYPTVRDFMRYDECGMSPVDRVVMNPPFSKGEWMAHIVTAYDALRIGGRLAAIVPNSIHAIMSRDGDRAGFAAWLDGCDYEIERVPGKPFATVGYDVSVSILTINRKG